MITDNTEGTRMIKDINPGNNSSNPTGPMKEMGSYITSPQMTGHKLWRTDGTEAGTTLVRDIHEERTVDGHGIHRPWHGEYTMTHNGYFYFSASDGESGKSWRTDGTEEGPPC